MTAETKYAELWITVADEDGNPVPNLTVTALSNSIAVPNLKTDGDGRLYLAIAPHDPTYRMVCKLIEADK